MKNYVRKLLLLAVLFCIYHVTAQQHEVWESGNLYYWKTFDVERGSTPDLATAIQNAIGTGNREVHITTGGTLSRTINLEENLTLRCHNNTFIKGHGGTGFHREGTGGISIYDMVLTRSDGSGFGIRTSRASDLVFSNITIRGGGIGLRIDSHPSRPYEDGRWIYNVRVENSRFENTSSHGLETYGVDGFEGDGLVARNTGGCGVLLNKTNDGTIGSVDAYRCNYGGGYAGLRYANNCSNITAEHLIARECGRGYFVLTGTSNTTLLSCEILDCTDIGIWLENVTNSVVESGCTNSGVAVSGAGSYANVSNSCSNLTYYRLQNRETGLFLDGMGRTTAGSAVGQYNNSTHINTQWALEPAGNYFKLRNRGTGLYLDGMGRTSDGADLGQYSNNSSNNQQWERIAVNGYYKLRNRSTGLFVDGMGRTEDGANSGQWSDSPSYNQQWAFLSSSASSQNAAVTTKLEENDFRLYPTTVEDQVSIQSTLDLQEDTGVEVYNTIGVLVHKGKLEKGNGTLNLSNLSSGIYIVRMTGSKDVISKRIVKK